MADREKLNTILPLSMVGAPPVESRPRSSRLETRGAISLSGLWPNLVQAMPVPVLLIDERQQVALQNDAAVELVGDEAEGLLGFSVGRVLSLERLEEARAVLLQQAGRYRYEDVLRLDAGDRDVSIDVDLLVVQGRELLCLVIQDLELTRREQAEWGDEPDTTATARSLSPERLQQAHRFETLGHLTGSMAHEFNNLLSVILGSLELAERSLQQEGDPRGDLDRAMLAAERSAETIGHILRYTRRRAGDDEAVSPQEVIEELRGLVERTLRKDTRVVIDAPCTCRVLATVAQLETALLNLVINARDAIEASEGEVVIACSDRVIDEAGAQFFELKPGRYVAISVSDNGAGVPSTARGRVFEPFFTTKPEGRGTGLGLSTVRSFARKAGGAVRLESVEGEGTTVEIVLPAVNPPSSEI